MPVSTKKEFLTANERLQLIALATLARQHTVMLNDLRRAAIEITGEEEDYGVTSDAIHGDKNPITEMDEALATLGLDIDERG